MSYCVAADVQADFKGLVFTASTLVTLAAVTQFIAEADSVINAHVGQRWVTPVTTGEAATLMMLFSRTLAGARVRAILRNNQTTNTDANQTAKGDSYTVKDVMTALIAIKNGEMQLNGGVLLLAGATAYSDNFARGVTPRFSKDRKQW